MAKLIKAKVIENKLISPGCFKISLDTPALAREAIAGQFLHIRIGDNTEPLLRRPISIHRIAAKYVEILFKTVGKGTETLSRKKSGDTIDLIGPLGNGFKIFKESPSHKFIVAGGMGVAPLVCLAEEFLKQRRGRSPKSGLTVVLGATTAAHIICVDEFKSMGADIYVATEDGSLGERALATDLTRKVVRSKKYRLGNVCFYAAGPMAMIKALCVLTEGCSIESQASLEERMACGLGACLGCAVDTQSGYKRVCKDGPVFNMCEIICE